MEIFWNKISLTGCKWAILNAPSTETPVSHSLLEESLFFISAPAASLLPFSGVIRNWTPQYERSEGGNFLEQNQLSRRQMVQFGCPKVRNPCVSFTFVQFPFPIFIPCPFLPSSLWGNKNWFIMGGLVKRWKFFGTKSV